MVYCAHERRESQPNYAGQDDNLTHPNQKGQQDNSKVGGPKAKEGQASTTNWKEKHVSHSRRGTRVEELPQKSKEQELQPRTI